MITRHNGSFKDYPIKLNACYIHETLICRIPVFNIRQDLWEDINVIWFVVLCQNSFI